MKNYDYIIVGGGASGSVLAIMLAKKNYKVAVIDKNLFPAKKLLVTGNGKCNITNKNLDSSFYNTNIDCFLHQFDFEKTKNFFSEMGIEIVADEKGRCYPLSFSAKSVVNAIKNQFEKLKIDFIGETSFENFKKQNDTFVVYTDKGEFVSSKLVIACGGNSIEKTLKDNKIEYRKNVPSLVALKTVENTKSIEGQRLDNVLVKAISADMIMQEYGEILFKDNGISGICIFNLSSMFARNNNFNGKIMIDIFPNIKENILIDMIKQQAKIYENKKDILNTFVGEKIANEIIKRAEYFQKTSKKDFFKLCASIIKNFEFTICGHYDNNQVFSGGISLENLTRNLKSKVVDNLYFCGEICDVDGICGGYNLQWAWCSAFAVSDDK